MIENLADELGVVLRRDAVAAGLSDRAIWDLVRRGVLVRVRQGVYCLARAWSEAQPDLRHTMLATGVDRIYGPDVAVSHVSACLLHGGPAWGLDLTHAHLTHLAAVTERRQARVIHHRSDLRVRDVTRFEGRWVTSPTRTALDTAAVSAFAPAVAVLDHFLNCGSTSIEALRAELDRRSSWPDHLDLTLKVGAADRRSESVAETRLRLILVDLRIGEVVPQYEVRTPAGRFVGRADFWLPRLGVLVEVDGRDKYFRLRRPGESMDEFLYREKIREDEMRQVTQAGMARLRWVHLDRPTECRERIVRAAARRAA